MTNRKRLSLADLRLAVEEVGASPAALGKRLGISRNTVYRYLHKYPELKNLFEDKRGTEVDERTQKSYEAVKAAILNSHGIKTSVAGALMVSRQTVDNYLERWPELADLLDAQRSKLVSQATSALVKDVTDNLSDGHQRAYLFVLKTLGRDEGFAERQEITGADGSSLFDFSPDVVRLIEVMGLDTSAVVKQFEALVRAKAQQAGIAANG